LECINKAIELYDEYQLKDFAKLAKLLARKASIYKYLDDLENSITFYEKSLLEDVQYTVKEQLKAVQKLKKEKDEIAYINPEIAEQVNEEAKAFFLKGDFPNALK